MDFFKGNLIENCISSLLLQNKLLQHNNLKEGCFVELTPGNSGWVQLDWSQLGSFMCVWSAADLLTGWGLLAVSWRPFLPLHVVHHPPLCLLFVWQSQGPRNIAEACRVSWGLWELAHHHFCILLVGATPEATPSKWEELQSPIARGMDAERGEEPWMCCSWSAMKVDLKKIIGTSLVVQWLRIHLSWGLTENNKIL